MPIPNIHPLLQAANHVEDYDLGTGGADGFTADLRADASDFDFGKPQPGQGSPTVAAKVSPPKSFASIVKAQPATSQPAATVPGVHRFESHAHQVIASGGFTLTPAPEREPRSPIMKKLVAAPSVKSALAAVVTAQKEFHAACEGTDKIIGHQMEAVSVLAQIANCTGGIAEIARLRATHAELVGPAAEVSAQAARRVQRAAHTPLAERLSELFDVVAVEFDKLTVATITSEKEFLSGWGLPYSPTPLASALAHVKTRCSHGRSMLALSQDANRVNSIAPTDGSELISLFTA